METIFGDEMNSIQQLRNNISEIIGTFDVSTDDKTNAILSSVANFIRNAPVPIDIDIWMKSKKAVSEATSLGLADIIEQKS